MGGRIAVVDAQDRFVRWASRKEIHTDHLVHRSVHVLVFHHDKLLIQRRHPEKDTYADHWDDSVAGHVEESDYASIERPDADLDALYRDVAGRELAEELGIETPLTEVGHLGPVADVHYEQMRVFTAEHAGPFTLQPDEVSAVQFVTRAELTALATTEKVTPALLWIADWLVEQGVWACPA